VKPQVVRWRPGIASGIAHATTQDDTYEGFFIPANTPIVMNIWGINHDPEEFDHPHVFDPTRFLQNPNGSKRGSDDAPNDNGSSSLRRPVYTFGAGRRVCVGKDMAKKSMLLTMAKVVWCFDIEAVSADELDTGMRGFHSGLLITPKPFKARFRVRGEDRKRIIEREWEKADAYLNQFG
jgi:cytochrome P450